MSGQNLIPFQSSRRARGALEDAAIAALVFVTVEAMMFAGMVSVFLLTRAAAGDAWPLAGQPLLPLQETAVNTAALLVSGGLVFRAAHDWQKWEARKAPLLLAAIALGAFFVFFQGIEWVALIRYGASQSSSQYSNFFCLTVGMYGAHALAAVTLLGIVWLRLKRGSLASGTFSAARILWYFAVGVWPVLYLCLYL
jgi:heme/copper-type cytochrome/quinol oxidase subunit 3